MQTLNLLQQIIHTLESGRGIRYVRLVALIAAFLVLLLRYDAHCYQNMSAPAAMDAAQLAHNIASGKGYTTQFIRPLSIYLIGQQHHDASDKDPARLNSGHPDISNAPVYPVLLAGLMNVLPFHFDAGLKGNFWSTPDARTPGGRRGAVYQPDFLIALFNQVLLVALLVLVFFWARRMFDLSVARLSVVLSLGSVVLWRFSVSGLSTMLLVVLFMALVWCLTLWESEMREPKWGAKSLIVLSLAAGVLTGVCGLTRYTCLALILPVAIFVGVFGGTRRALYCALTLAGFGLVISPWIVRNYAVSGTAFGTASFKFLESFSSGFKLERSLQPDLPHYLFVAYLWKISSNIMPMLQEDLFKMSGGWISAFFIVGLMVGFRNAGLRRMRYFVVGCLVALAITEALARTQLTDETPEINSENLVVLLAPIILIYGVGLFYVLLEGIQFSFFEMRYVAITVFSGLLLLPMLFVLVSASGGPLAYPPYRPDVIQANGRMLKPDELMMSDIPWAVAWYGDRQCVWQTLNVTASPDNPTEWQESFFAINDALKPIHALYLTPRSLDARFQSQWVRGAGANWGHFIVDILLHGQVPPKFPLTKMPPGYLPEQVFLADWVRW